MKAIRVRGHVDEQHRLHAQVPATIAPGPIEVSLVIPTEAEDEAGGAWTEGVAREWREDLADPRQDIYTLDDGEPVDGAR